MSVSNAFSHLTLEERRIILTGITNGSTKTAIAQTIGKDKSTVGKEIKLHRALTHKCKMPLECNNYRKCDFGRQCTADWDGKRSSWLPLYTTIRKSPDGDEGRTYLRVYESQETGKDPEKERVSARFPFIRPSKSGLYYYRIQ